MGALGPVFRTYEPTRDRLVAVKVFRLDITPEQGQALADELAVAAQAGLFHPSIVEPIAAGMEGTVAYRAEEYVAAESLDVALRHYAPAALDKVLPFIAQLAGAIDFARRSSVGHGALHPRDIFVTPEEARATGFGVVEALERVGLRAPVRRPYSAPERVSGEPWSTPADVFSLGAIAYELLTGRRPSGVGPGIGDLAGSPPGGREEAVHAVLVRAMDEEPARRFQTAAEFASALESGSRGERPASAKTTPASGAPARSIVPAIVPVPHPAAEPEPMEPAPAEAMPVESTPVAPAAPGNEEHHALEPELDDVLIEQQEEESHSAVEREERRAEAAREQETRDLFDLEAIEDLALKEPAAERFTDDFNPTVLDEVEPVASDFSRTPPETLPDPVASDFSRTPPERLPLESLPPEDVTIPRRPAAFDLSSQPDYPESRSKRAGSFVLMLGLIGLGLLIGFGIGWGTGYGLGWRQTTATQDTEQAKAPGQATPATRDPSKPAGRAYSEQTITPPSAASPAKPTPSEAAPVPAPRTGDRTSKPAPAPALGRIIIRSVPSNAGVTVDGTWRGRTPLTLDKVDLGPHEVRVVQPGFSVARESIALTRAAPARTLSFRLRRTETARAPARPEREAAAPNRSGLAPAAGAPSGPGSLYVDSRPRGASVFLDGKRVGVTPAVIPDVLAGPHVVRLELVDHRVWTANSQVIPGQQTRVTGSLERIR